MHNDLKILFWMLMFALLVVSIYLVVDLAFKAIDNVSTSTYYKTFRTIYTNKPDEFDPDAKPDYNWKPRRERLPFLGYAHQSVIFIISGIFIVTIIGVLVVYILHRKENL